MPKNGVKKSIEKAPKSAVARPKTKSEIQIQGEDVILSGELAEHLRNWIDTRSGHAAPAPEIIVAGVLNAFSGAYLEKQKAVEVLLPVDLLEWANHNAYNTGETLSDTVRELLETERYRWARLHTFADVGGKAGVR